MKTVPLAEARRRFSALLSKLGEEPIMLTRRGKPVAVLLSLEEYERLRRLEAYDQFEALSQTLRESGSSARELHRSSRNELDEGRVAETDRIVTDEYIEELRGILKGGNALGTLMREREWERRRDK
ncbi:MAG: type II toxin-antitoxin system Phd/YefM family antitoxin [Anaerolineales bacterium]|nr:type II toxin-antitoxin system Phd/YefM family antitoxin [Anaerolineales bacterium]